MAEQDKETREKILDAAHAVFLRRGTVAARTQEIADEAGVNKALLHYYFGTKEALAAAVFQRAAGTLFPLIFGLLGSDAPLEEKIPEIIANYLDFLSARPYLVAYIITEVHSHPERARQMLPTRAGLPLPVLRRQIEERVAAGGMRPIAAEQFLVNLIALIVFPFVARPMLSELLQLDGDRFTAFIAERKRSLAEFFFNALRP